MIRLRPAAVAWAAAAAAALAAAAAELPSEWRHWRRYRAVELPVLAEAALVRLAVPEDLFQEARPDLADLRVIDAAGDDVGFVVFQRGEGPRVEWRTTELSDVGFMPGSHTQIVADTGEAAELHNAVEVTLPAGEEEFFTWVEVAASPDARSWRVVRERAPLYRFRQRGFDRAVAISYPRTRDRWLRLRLQWPEGEVAVERVRVAERVEEDEELLPVRHRLARRSDSPAGESRWEAAAGMPRVPIAAISVATERAAFHRPVAVSVSDDGESWRQVGAGSIYRYELAGGPAAASPDRHEALTLDVHDTAAAHWRVAVLDRDDPPIPDLEVTLMQSRRYVVFRAAPAGVYRLVYGNPLAEPPGYEIAALTPRDDLAAAHLAGLGPELVNAAWTSGEPFTERHPVILWAALGLAVVVLAGMALRMLRS